MHCAFYESSVGCHAVLREVLAWKIGQTVAFIRTAARQDRVSLAGLHRAKRVYPPDIARHLRFVFSTAVVRQPHSRIVFAAKRDGRFGANC